MKIFSRVFLILMFSLSCFSQTNNESENFRLIQTKPSAYITFEKFGKREPDKNDESKEGIWLRFHNNSKWNLFIRSLGYDKEKVYSIPYEVRERESFDVETYTVAGEKQVTQNLTSNDNKSKIPRGYIAHTSNILKIESGDTFVFSIPKEHLAKNLYISVAFSYEWEQVGKLGGVGQTKHTIIFLSTELPEEKK
jgi:hypothetical protein